MSVRYDPNASYANANHVNANLQDKVAQNRSLSFINDVIAMWRMFCDEPDTADLGILLFALGYFVFPIDAVPDFIPFAGYVDDAAVIAWAVNALGSVLLRYRR